MTSLGKVSCPRGPVISKNLWKLLHPRNNHLTRWKIIRGNEVELVTTTGLDAREVDEEYPQNLNKFLWAS
jgi:hypothetical protein